MHGPSPPSGVRLAMSSVPALGAEPMQSDSKHLPAPSPSTDVHDTPVGHAGERAATKACRDGESLAVSRARGEPSLYWKQRARICHAVAAASIPVSMQASVDRYVRGLETSHRLLRLHPRTQGHPKNAAALSPAIVLGTIATFEAFAEDFGAVAMSQAGSSFGEIAKRIGSLNNPDLEAFARWMGSYFPTAKPAITSGSSVDIFECPYIGRSSWVWKPRQWTHAVIDAGAWMQVRHCLTHGLTTGWRSEWWPGPLNANHPPAASVLRDMGGGKHSLVIHGAITCARIYAHGAQVISSAVAEAQGESLDWSKVPVFD